MTIKIINAHVMEALAGLESESVHSVCTSPPYWGLRDYGIPPQVWGGDPECQHDFDSEIVTGEIRTGLGMAALGERYRGGGKKAGDVPKISAERGVCRLCGAWRGDLGLEPTPDLYVEHMVSVFREVRRVLRSDGTLWLNIGDSYNAHPGQRKTTDSVGAKQETNAGSNTTGSRHVANLKPKDLIGIPWMLAFALRADGWWLRQDIIWSKPNPMPESVTDRCTKAHEQIFLLAKSERYFFDAEAIKEPASPATHARISQDLAAQVGSYRANGGNKTNGPMKAVMSGSARKIAEAGSGIANNRSYEAALALKVENRNRRSVWTVATQPFSEAHFATFPPALVEPCILAGTSAKGVCSKCGAPWVRVIEKESAPKEVMTARAAPTDGLIRSGQRVDGEMFGSGQKLQNWRNAHPAETVGWRASCACEAAVVPATVLDCFGGAGTVGLVADRLGRDAILIELNPEYAELARNRLIKDAGLFADIAAD